MIDNSSFLLNDIVSAWILIFIIVFIITVYYPWNYLYYSILISFSHSTISSCISSVTPSVRASSRRCVFLWNWIQLAGDSKYLRNTFSFHAMAARKEVIRGLFSNFNFSQIPHIFSIFQFSQIQDIFSKHVQNIPDKCCPHCPTLQSGPKSSFATEW